MRPIYLLAALAAPVATAALFAPRAPIHASPGTSGAWTTTLADAATAPIRMVVAPTGNEARYRVNEQLAGFDLPNDAVGVTGAITGAVVVDNGRLVPGQSRVTVNLTGLKSDSERRDGYVQRRLLETEKYPTVEIVPTAVRGLTGALPASGTRSFELVGDLKVRDATRPTVWQVRANFAPGRVSGTAVTKFTFEQFGLTKPKVASVLSVADTIQLEYDFNLVAEAARR